MRIAARSGLTLAGICVLLVGVMSMSPGAGAAAPTSNHTYQFVDTNVTGEQCCIGYNLPALPTGPYLVSVFAQLVPSDIDIPNETFYCIVSDTSTGTPIVWNQVTYNGEFSPTIGGTATYRITKKSKLQAGCSAEHGDFHFLRPLQVNITRLDSMTTIPMTPL